MSYASPSLDKQTAYIIAYVMVLLFSLLAVNSHGSTEDEFWLYKVQPTDSVWSISQDLLINWRFWEEIVQINNIKNDKTMRPGRLLRLPKRWVSKQPAAIRVVNVIGSVKYVQGELERALSLDSLLQSGSIVETSVDSTAYLEFEDQTRILVLPESKMLIHTATMLGNNKNVINIKVELQQGEVEIDANPDKTSGSYFLIETPSAHATTRGTKYRIRANDSQMATEVLWGNVDVANKQGEVAIKAGLGSITYKDRAPKPPKRLLSAPSLPVYTEALRILPTKIKWRELKGASEYRVQLSEDKKVTAIVFDKVTKSNTISLPATLLDQKYYLRVSGINAEGLQGKGGVADFVVNARPFAPLLSTPQTTDRLYPGQVDFSWTQPELATHFIFEISKDSQFDTLFYIKDNISSSRESVKLDVGSYFWRVTSVDASGEIGIPSHVATFVVNALPPKLTMAKPVLSEHRFSVSWQAEEGVDTYNIQFSRDSNFTEILADKQVSQPSFDFSKPEVSGDYFLRVRGVDKYAQLGEWSPVQKITVPLDLLGVSAFAGIALLVLLL